MARTLDVYLNRDLAGKLTQDDSGRLMFDYAESWLSNPDAMPLSYSLPLRKETFNEKECAGYFNGILPESDPRTRIAKNLGISPRNDFSMLEKIGGECAGAVTLLPAGEPLPEHNNQYQEYPDEKLAELLKALPRRPMLAGQEGFRMSLAGAQEKIAVKLNIPATLTGAQEKNAVVIDKGQITVPKNGAPSTHILKPDNKDYPGLVFNELLCMKLAKEINLSVANAEARSVQGIDFLLVERYDRRLIENAEGQKTYERIHQEDFCQALGITSTRKYQSEGGPSFKDCFELIRKVSSIPMLDLKRLLEAAIFNYLVGNNDAHGKNFSLIYPEKGVTRLAPLYDLVSTVYYPDLSKKMGMKIGGEYDSEKVTPRHFDKFSDDTQLAKPLVKKSISEVAENILKALQKVDLSNPTAQGVAKIIKDRCLTAIKEFV
jgi:serine/threonine-protein kinase HipA